MLYVVSIFAAGFLTAALCFLCIIFWPEIKDLVRDQRKWVRQQTRLLRDRIEIWQLLRKSRK